MSDYHLKVKSSTLSLSSVFSTIKLAHGFVSFLTIYIRIKLSNLKRNRKGWIAKFSNFSERVKVSLKLRLLPLYFFFDIKEESLYLPPFPSLAKK